MPKTTRTTGEIEMAQVMVGTEDLKRWSETIHNMAQFILFSGVATKEQRVEMATLGTLHAELIERRISNVTDDFGSGVVIDFSTNRVPVLAGNDGGVS